MNTEAFERFACAYRAGLLAAVQASPEEYVYPATEAPTVADRMLTRIASSPGGVNYTGGGFRRACKAIGIKATRKAIFSYLGIV